MKKLFSFIPKSIKLIKNRGFEGLMRGYIVVQEQLIFRYHTYKKSDEVIEIINGSKMLLNTKSDGINRELLLHKIREVYHTEMIRDNVVSGDIVFDIGANIGYYTLLESKIVGGKGKVYCFEPHPDNFSRLLKNINLNNCMNTVCYQLAFSDKIGTAELYISEACNRHTLTGGDKSISVECDIVDTFVESNGIIPNVIRMDVEGAETNIIKGMEKTMEHPLKLFMELHPHRVEHHKMVDMLTTLYNNNFEIVNIASNDNYLGYALGIAKMEDISLKEFIKDKRLKNKTHGFNVFLKN